VINKAIQGYQSKGGIHSGLLDKCPAISYFDRTETTGDEIEKVSRRAKVFSWDQDIYKDWAGVGRVWLDEDHGGKPLRHQRQTEPAAKSRELPATNPQVEPTSDCGENENIYNNNKLLKSNRGISDHIIRENVPVESTCTSATDIFDSATKLKTTEIHPEKSSIEDSTKNSICGLVAGVRGNEKNPPLNEPGASSEKRESFVVKSDDFKKLDVSARGPCDRCGSRYVDYTEKLTKDRIARKNEPSRRICKKCYTTAKRREAETFRSLPGALNISGMARTYTDFGNCEICNKQKATWRDPVNHTHICDTCFVNAGGVITQGGKSCHS
jgi:hypothetical protein